VATEDKVQRIVDCERTLKPAPKIEPTFKVELTANALTHSLKMAGGKASQSFKNIFRQARPDGDRAYAAEHDNFTYCGKINPHTMSRPLINAAMVAARGGTERDHRALEINYSEVKKEKFVSFERAEKERQEKWAAERKREEEQRKLKDEQQTHQLLKEHVRNRDPALAAQIERTQHRDLEKQMMMRKNMDEQQRAEHERQAAQRAHEIHQARLRAEAESERVERFHREHMERERLRKEKSERETAAMYRALAEFDFECQNGSRWGVGLGGNPFGPPVYLGIDW
jgi:hypothetical protein